jgi:hypothetical protein
LFSLYPNQLPQHFEIATLLNEITSWLTSLLQKLPVKVKEQLREEHMRAKHDPGSVALPWLCALREGRFSTTS